MSLAKITLPGLADSHSYIIDDVVSNLRKLHESGCSCHVVTRNYGCVIVPTLDMIGLLSLFDTVVTNCKDEYFRCETDLNEDQDATFARLIAEHEVRPSQCVVYEDSQKNVELARAIGMDAVLVYPPSKSETGENG